MNDETRSGLPQGAHPDPTSAIRATMLGALVAGGICLYFGFAWLVDAPASSTEQSEPTWYAIDHAFRWALRIVGAGFLLVAALAASGKRASAGLGAVVEVVFALLMLAMAIETFVEARADGGFDAVVILLLIVMVIGLSAARYSWSLYTRSAARPVERL